MAADKQAGCSLYHEEVGVVSGGFPPQEAQVGGMRPPVLSPSNGWARLACPPKEKVCAECLLHLPVFAKIQLLKSRILDYIYNVMQVG